MSWFKPPPPGTHLTPWVPDLIFTPISRAFERLGVYFYNRVLNKTEVGLYDRRWNKNIHGPYCHYRYYGKLDTKLLDVKLNDLPAWIGRREKTPSAFYNEFMRNLYRVHHLYFSGPVYACPVSKAMSRRGALIVFEGVDRSGKSTQAKRLSERILVSGGRSVLLPFPDRNEPFGQVIDRYLKKEINLSERALHLAFSANRWEKATMIEEQIAMGVDVICDRYCFSGVAYSIAKGLDPHWVRQSDIGLPCPDVVLYFEVSPSVAQKRGGYGDERLENDELQQKVHSIMKELKKHYWKTVNADDDMETVGGVVEEIYSQINRDGPLRRIDAI
ncbi:dTMP kinase [Dictyocaulus viviparus]|uniref:Thymidylate kinase n=1 Tax=Dictyocaulus viviparus TaxID=29172 RepID=A0A0D8XKN0_DICVI|nr:dTMP kinase [Dictyocaulus viviparus]